MTQKTSPFIESSYGWNLGESGWNVGMDENLLKFSFLLDGNIDGIVDSLPSNPSNGASYFLNTDKRIYYYVVNTWYSTPTPKWFNLTTKADGQDYIFDGNILTAVQSSANLASRIVTLENKSNSLKSAAYSDASSFGQASAVVVNATKITDVSSQVLTKAPLAAPPLTGNATLDSSPLVNRRKLQLEGFVSIIQYGADSSGTVSVSSILQTVHDALPNTGGKITFPAGTFPLNSTVTITKPITLEGAGGGYNGITVFTTNNATSDILVIGSEFAMSGFKFTSSVSKTAGAFIKGTNVSRVSISRFFIEKYYIGIEMDGGSEFNIFDGQMFDGTAGSVAPGSCAMRFGMNNYTGSLSVRDVYIKCQDNTKQCSFGIQMRYVDVVNMAAVCIILHGNDLQIDPQNGQTASLMFFDGCTIDTAVNGMVIAPVGTGRVIRSAFGKCWFGEHTTTGVVITGTGTTDGISITESILINNRSCGINIDTSTAKNITIAQNTFAGCTTAGVRLVGTMTTIVVDSNFIGAYAGAAGNGTGIIISSAVSGSVTDNKFLSNTTNINNSSMNIAGLWTSYTPVVTSVSGTITSYTASGRYININGGYHWKVNISITNNGTGAGALNISLPMTPLDYAVLCGRAAGVSSKQLQGYVSGGSTTLTCYNYDGSYPASNGELIVLQGFVQT